MPNFTMSINKIFEIKINKKKRHSFTLSHCHLNTPQIPLLDFIVAEMNFRKTQTALRWQTPRQLERKRRRRRKSFGAKIVLTFKVQQQQCAYIIIDFIWQ